MNSEPAPEESGDEVFDGVNLDEVVPVFEQFIPGQEGVLHELPDKVKVLIRLNHPLVYRLIL